MKFKKIMLITLILLSVLTVSAVSASENNATNEVITLENNENIDNLTVESSNNDILEQPIANENDNELKASINNDSSQSTVLSVCSDESTVLSVSINQSDILSASSTSYSSSKVVKTTKKISGTKVIAFKKSKYYPVKKTLKTKDTLYSIYPANPNGQFGKGITLQIVRNGLSGYALHTKVKKVKFYYKNQKTGKYKIKTVTKIKNDKICIFIKSSLIKGYKPIKAKIWYTSR